MSYPTRSVVAPLAMLLLLCAASCGGGGSGDRGRAGGERLSFDGPARTVLPSGALRFTLSSGLAAGERLVCSLDGAEISQCPVDRSAGTIPYEDLAVGIHRFKVEVRQSDGGPATSAEHTLERTDAGVVVFAATPGGITAAIAAARSGQTAAIIEPTQWVGGAISGGLAKTDVGTRGAEIVGGLTAEFFTRLRTREQVKGSCIPAQCRATFDAEPHEAEALFEAMLGEAGVIVERAAALLAVEKSGDRILGLVTSRGAVTGKIFVDASYEGDLVALAGVEHRIGREPRVLANPPDDPVQLAAQEDDAGTLRYRLTRSLYVDPYLTPGDAASGTVPFVEPRPNAFERVGDGDQRVMAYTYRLCVTDDPTNRQPFARPDDYRPAQYEASARVASAWVQAQGVDLAETMFNPEPVALSANRAYFKYDLNGGSTFSTDMTAPDLNQAYLGADEAGREAIRAAYRSYIRGLLYFWQTDPRFGGLNAKLARFGFCKDEFADRGGWPHQLYVRVGRRMVGDYVMNENDVMQNGRRPPVADVVGFGAYDIDMHTFRYLAAPFDWPDGIRRDSVSLEGAQIIKLPNDKPYPVSYRVLVPRASDATNLLSPVSLSATHVAYASLRMEPTFMILGEAAGVAAAIAITTGQSVQAVDYATLRQELLHRGQRLTN